MNTGKPTLFDDSFADPALAQIACSLTVVDNGRMTNSAQLLVRQTDVRCDESGNHPGEVFAMVSITRDEVRALLEFLDEDWNTTLAICGDPNTPEKVAERMGKGN